MVCIHVLQGSDTGSEADDNLELERKLREKALKSLQLAKSDKDSGGSNVDGHTKEGSDFYSD